MNAKKNIYIDVLNIYFIKIIKYNVIIIVINKDK